MFRSLPRKLGDASMVIKPYHYNLRASIIPVCQYKVFFTKLYNEDCNKHEAPKEFENFMSDYFKAVGTIVHTVLQRWLGRIGVLFGNWLCKNCGTYIEHHLGFPTCQCSIPEWEYVEYKLNSVIEPFASAHCDGLLQLSGMNVDEFILMDIKTCSLKDVETMTESEDFARDFHMKYVHQLAVYDYGFRLKYPRFKIVGKAILFIPRDNPLKMILVIVEYPNRITDRFVTNAVDEYNFATEAYDKKTTEGLEKLCSNRKEAESCKYGDVCFSSKCEEEINRLITKIGSSK